jgi:lipid-A-disaccharide synthase-like uncharacterized protein
MANPGIHRTGPVRHAVFVQWLYSERHKRSLIPTSFWYLSIAGGCTLLSYAIHQQDPVFVTGQATGVFIYLRNLYLLRGVGTETPQGE